jgi:hypothetical protein
MNTNPWDDWGIEIQNNIKNAIKQEADRTKIAAKFLRHQDTADPIVSDIQSDKVNVNTGTDSSLTVDSSTKTKVLEIQVEFALTEQQYQKEADWMTAVSLVIKAANMLSRAEDLLIFLGSDAQKNDLFKTVQITQGNTGTIEGLLPSATQIISVKPTVINTSDPSQNRYGENTFSAVARGYSILQNMRAGRIALVLPTNPFADTWESVLQGSMIIPADRIKGLLADRIMQDLMIMPNDNRIERLLANLINVLSVDKHFYSTSTLPNQFSNDKKYSKPQGLLVALDGNTMDLVMLKEPDIQYMPNRGPLYHFRVYERFALRIKDPLAIVRLDFEKGSDKEQSA